MGNKQSSVNSDRIYVVRKELAAGKHLFYCFYSTYIDASNHVQIAVYKIEDDQRQDVTETVQCWAGMEAIKQIESEIKIKLYGRKPQSVSDQGFTNVCN